MRTRWIVALLLSAAPSAVAAQEQGGDVLRDTDIVVTATGQTQAESGTKTATRLIEVPQSISVITREELDVRAVHSVTEALAYTAGVQAEQDGIDSRADSFRCAASRRAASATICSSTASACPRAGNGPAPHSIPSRSSRSRC